MPMHLDERTDYPRPSLPQELPIFCFSCAIGSFDWTHRETVARSFSLKIEGISQPSFGTRSLLVQLFAHRHLQHYLAMQMDAAYCCANLPTERLVAVGDSVS